MIVSPAASACLVTMEKRQLLTWSRSVRLMRVTQFWSIPEEAGALRSATYPRQGIIAALALVRECSLGRSAIAAGWVEQNK